MVRVISLFGPFVLLTVLHGSLQADQQLIHFDLAPVAVAKLVSVSDNASDPSPDAMPGETLVACDLQLSSMIASPRMPRVDQWLVRCQPRDPRMAIVDYSPRTEFDAEVEGSIQVKELDERSDSFGLSLDASPGFFLRGNLGGDHGETTSETIQYNRVAPVRAVTASGTINRGRGVYFKLRWTASQALEGEKVFRLVLSVPSYWRTGLIDVSVVAQSHHRRFGGWDEEVTTVGSAGFVVAVHRAGDVEASAIATEMADVERIIRSASRREWDRHSINPIPAMIRHVAKKLDPESDTSSDHWLDRLIIDQVHPSTDPQMQRLPHEIRHLARDYCDLRKKFVNLGDDKRQTTND